MKMLGLTARIRRKRKYSSYHGEVGKKAENLIQRQFEAENRWKSAIQTLQNLPFQQATKTIFITNFRWLITAKL